MVDLTNNILAVHATGYPGLLANFIDFKKNITRSSQPWRSMRAWRSVNDSVIQTDIDAGPLRVFYSDEYAAVGQNGLGRT